MTKFYTFHQNNSGGVFGGPALNVIVEANSTEHANERAHDFDVYFDGVDKGHDCECCGDRWYPTWEDGTEKPEVYGKPAEKYTSSWADKDIPAVKVYYLNGDVKTYGIVNN